jgi:hypothetical protein
LAGAFDSAVGFAALAAAPFDLAAAFEGLAVADRLAFAAVVLLFLAAGAFAAFLAAGVFAFFVAAILTHKYLTGMDRTDRIFDF